MHGDDEALLLEVAREDGLSLVGRGDPHGVRRLVAEAARGPVSWLTIPRLGAGPVGVLGEPADEGAGHRPDADLDPAVQSVLGVRPASAWDWLVTGEAPAQRAPEVVRLDLAADGDAILACLAESNPDTSAHPGHRGEVAWFGVRAGRDLVGVVGAGERPGGPAAGSTSWHLHGLGVRPAARGCGLGGALTAVTTAAAIDAGADWVSLGMYASNGAARRLYLRLGFVVEARFTTYRPVTAAPAARH